MDAEDALARLDRQLDQMHRIASLLDDQATVLGTHRLHRLLAAVDELREQPASIPDQRAP